jgi:hypothetical protein
VDCWVVVSVTSLNDWLDRAAVDSAPIVPFVQKEPLRTIPGFAAPTALGQNTWADALGANPSAKSGITVPRTGVAPDLKACRAPMLLTPFPSRARPEKPYPVRSQIEPIRLFLLADDREIRPRKVILFRKGTDVCDLIATLPQIRTYRGACRLRVLVVYIPRYWQSGSAVVPIDLPFGPLPTHDPGGRAPANSAARRRLMPRIFLHTKPDYAPFRQRRHHGTGRDRNAFSSPSKCAARAFATKVPAIRRSQRELHRYTFASSS